MITRKQTLAITRYEYATHGKETRESMRAYIEIEYLTSHVLRLLEKD